MQFTKRCDIETDPCRALECDIFHNRAWSDVRDVKEAVNNLREIVRAMFACLDLDAQIKVLTALGWEKK